MKILIVDDKKENLILLDSLLKGFGHEVGQAANGQEALEVLRKDSFEMVISDILMPVMDGYQLCREVRSDPKLKEMLFIFYTATYTEKDDEKLAYQLGADKYLQKPMAPDQFMEVIQSLVRDAEKRTFKSVHQKPSSNHKNLKLYNERLVHKLEQKMMDLEKEVEERKRAEKQIQHDLKEKEILLKEVHHRVRNNLQIIESLINLQTRKIPAENSAMIELLTELRTRFHSIALVHDQCYQSENFVRIDFNDYIQKLVKDLYHQYVARSPQIAVDFNVEKLYFPLDLAVPFGLVVNELVTNAFKHAFPPSFSGDRKVEISLIKSLDNEVEFVVEDCGIGLPGTIDLDEAKTLGLHLTRLLAEDQLGGKITHESVKGTRFVVRFKAGE